MSLRGPIPLLPIFLTTALLTGPARCGELDVAIDAAARRVVKLYGASIGMSEGYGSGIVVSGDGLVLTVSSLLLDSPNLRAVTSDGVVHGADLVATDRDRQLALLRLRALDAAGGAPADGNAAGGASGPARDFFDFANPGELTPGSWVIAVANPFKVADGAEPPSVSVGVVSAHTDLDATLGVNEFSYTGPVVVIDAITSNPGAPGGALVDLQGRLVGMLGRVVRSNLTHTYLNYAIPTDVLADFISTAAKESATTVADPPVSSPGKGGMGGAEPAAEVFHGIKLMAMGYQRNLVYVDRVARGSPAALAGVRKDDLILSVNGRSVQTVEDFDAQVARLHPGDEVELTVMRGEAIEQVRFTLQPAH